MSKTHLGASGRAGRIPHGHNTGFHGNWIADSELEQLNGQP